MVETLDQESLFFDDQDINFNLEEFYTNWIQFIDNYRSSFDATSVTILDNFSQDNLDKLISSSKLSSQDLLESRTHAFYRLIGLPVMDQDGNFYSPGFDKESNLSPSIFQSKASIANNFDPKLKEIINLREKFFQKNERIFDKQDINSISLAMHSIFLRPLDSFNTTNPLESDKQKYILKERNSFNNILADSSGEAPTLNTTTNNHYIKPLIVDPRIEMTVIPIRSKIVIPFVLSKVDTKIRSDLFLKRPLIEKICRIRFNSKNNKDEIGNYVNSLVSIIKNSNFITDKELVQNITNIDNLAKFYRSEIIIFKNLFKIMKSLMEELFKNVKTIFHSLNEINWIPIPNNKGPEFNSELRDIIQDDKLNKKIEKDILTATIKKTILSIEFDITTNNKDVDNFVFDGINDIVLGNIKNISTIFQNQIDKLNKRRNKAGKEANDALRSIEIIMGEFSGLGLVDIIAIYSALFTIEQKALYSLLDERTRVRLAKIPELQNDIVAAKSIYDGKTALKKLEEEIKRNYAIMSSLYEKLASNLLKR